MSEAIQIGVAEVSEDYFGGGVGLELPHDHCYHVFSQKEALELAKWITELYADE